MNNEHSSPDKGEMKGTQVIQMNWWAN